jgi:tetratricopeptide (TPR) repeat protein
MNMLSGNVEHRSDTELYLRQVLEHGGELIKRHEGGIGKIVGQVAIAEFIRGSSITTFGNEMLEFEAAQLGAAPSDIARTYQQVGELSLMNFKSNEVALRFGQRALEIRKQIRGEQHPETADSYFLVGIAKNQVGANEEALELVQRALDIRIKVFGDLNREVAECYFGVAIVQSELGHHELACNNAKRAIEIFEKVLGKENSGYFIFRLAYEAIVDTAKDPPERLGLNSEIMTDLVRAEMPSAASGSLLIMIVNFIMRKQGVWWTLPPCGMF